MSTTMVTDPIDDGCPGCGATTGVQPQPAPPKVRAWTCTACGMGWACTVVNPALPIIGLLPTPELRTAALLTLLRTEVTRRSAQEDIMTTTATVCFPVDQVVEFDAMATVDTTIWWCRICGQEGIATTTPHATDDAMAHLGTDHGGVRGLRTEVTRNLMRPRPGRRLSQIPPCSAPRGLAGSNCSTSKRIVRPVVVAASRYRVLRARRQTK